MLVGWVDYDPAKELWADSILAGEEKVRELLLNAFESCEIYAPKLPDGAPVPQRYKDAQVLQARAIWQMQRQGPGDQFGADGLSIAIYPLDARIRQMLRPKKPLGGML
ncbi:head-to-tail adaptor [Arthrobacter phage Yavru]|uniref:Head-to-tail adaptor n=1 Tax=Arthrobacter phage Yavru TaxID=2776857 RepID=A0A7M1CJ26_9CAUD|nr:head-to-tail adaptor [Arthrobacter phage Yavru]QOP64217.1 head-to-tail adaptor [Arthrobacter phage Yavru]